MRGGPYGIATGPPLHHNSSSVATLGGPHGWKTVAFQDKNKALKMMRNCVLGKPQGPYGIMTGQKPASWCMAGGCRKGLIGI